MHPFFLAEATIHHSLIVLSDCCPSTRRARARTVRGTPVLSLQIASQLADAGRASDRTIIKTQYYHNMSSGPPPPSRRPAHQSTSRQTRPTPSPLRLKISSSRHHSPCQLDLAIPCTRGERRRTHGQLFRPCPLRVACRGTARISSQVGAQTRRQAGILGEALPQRAEEGEGAERPGRCQSSTFTRYLGSNP